MSDENLSPETQARLDAFKEKWIGAMVRIVGINHPWRGVSGVVRSIDLTNAGAGMRVELENGESCYVFKSSDIENLSFNTRQPFKK